MCAGAIAPAAIIAPRGPALALHPSFRLLFTLCISLSPRMPIVQLHLSTGRAFASKWLPLTSASPPPPSLFTRGLAELQSQPELKLVLLYRSSNIARYPARCRCRNEDDDPWRTSVPRNDGNGNIRFGVCVYTFCGVLLARRGETSNFSARLPSPARA